MDLKTLRGLIDEADLKLLRLLDERMQLGVWAGRLKTSVLDSGREEQVLRNARERGYGLLDGPFLERMFRTIMEESRRLQGHRFRLIAFQGERGAWSELAARRYDAELVSMPCRAFADVFRSVSEGATDMGIVPVENSIEGAVGEVNDLLVETELRIVAEVYQPIHHCLMATPGTRIEDVRTVYSHPQALGQCRTYLASQGFEPRPFYDTAGAARWLANDRPPSSAAIASPLAAWLYGLDVLADRVEDYHANTTRFLVITRNGEPSGGGKCSIVFSAPHRAGALLDVLSVFAEEQLNLTRIESRPVRSDPGAFAFLLDFLGAENDEHVIRALKRVPGLTLNWRVLGFYPRGTSESE